VPNQLNGTPFFVDTLALANVQQTQTFGLEALWVAGPLSVQSEGMAVMVERNNANTAFLHGAYVQVGYFLTGEHRPYDRKAGAIDRVIPYSNYGHWCCNGEHGHGIGAWEIAARYSYIDLDDAGIVGGVEHNATLGVNWYLNPYTKLVFNYIRADVDASNGLASRTDIFGLRAQVDF
jgi:phosphate-selective porin OprO/OprP